MAGPSTSTGVPWSFEPLRPLDDFLLESARFQTPNIKELERWGKRVKENLVYYQSNYFLLALVVFLILGIMRPAPMLLGALTTILMILVYHYITENQRSAMLFKRDHPLACVLLFIAAGYATFALIGSVLVFMFGICLPLSLIFLHASFRLRNLKNKLANYSDKFGVKSTPMGMILSEFGMAFEGFKD